MIMLVPVVPASDLRCPTCEVDWMKATDGPDCWDCGQPGVPGYVMSCVMSTGDPFVERFGEGV